MDNSEIQSLLTEAVKGGDADEVLARCSRRRELILRYADNEIIQPTAVSTARLGITVSFGKCSGSASTGDLSPDGIRRCRKIAEEIARTRPPDPEHMPLVPPQESYPETHSFAENTANLGAEESVQLVKAAIEEAAERNRLLSGSLSVIHGTTAVANSAGLFGENERTVCHFLATGFAGEAAGWAQDVVTDAGDLDAVGTARRALDKAEACRDPVSIDCGRYTVVLEPEASANFFLPLFWGMNARSADEGRSAMSGKEGDRIGGEGISLVSDPSDVECPGAPFTGEGFALKPVSWIEDGYLKNLVTGRYWAQETGREPTGPPSNIIMPGGTATDEEIISRVSRGLLVTRLFYVRSVDPMVLLNTGMTRDGLFLIEDGHIAGAVKNMRWNDSPLDALDRIEQLGVNKRVGSASMPTIMLRDFHFSSKTEF